MITNLKSFYLQFVNEDDHAIWFEFYRVNDRRGRKLVMPGRSTQIDFGEFIEI